MDKQTISEALAEHLAQNAPVRHAVLAAKDVILAAREAGVPLAVVYRLLVKDGQYVGKGPSSFYTAVKWLDKHSWTLPAFSRELTATGEREATQPTPTDLRDDTRGLSTGRPSYEAPSFADIRYSNDFE